MSQHTPGPWAINKYGGIGGGDFGISPIIVDALGFDTDATADDIHLIAAAPDLLDACRAVLLFHNSDRWTESKRDAWTAVTGEVEATTKVLCDHIRKCIAKAEGR